MEGKCTVVFRTVYAPTCQDIDAYLGTAPLGGGTGVNLPLTGGGPTVSGTGGRPALS
jgi:hypothetical protein